MLVASSWPHLRAQHAAPLQVLCALRVYFEKREPKKDLSRAFEMTTMFHFVISSPSTVLRINSARNLSPVFSFFAGVRSTRTLVWHITCDPRGPDCPALPQSRRPGPMLHALSLRVIGQTLELASVNAFELEKHGQYYVVWSDSLTDASRWITQCQLTTDCYAAGARQDKLRCSLCFSRSDITRLDHKASKRRRHQSSSYVQGSKLSQLLRTVGDHLDRNSVAAFHLSWMPQAVNITVLPVHDLGLEKTTLTPEKLQQLSLHTRLRRSKPHMNH